MTNVELGIKLKFDGKEVEGGISLSREQLRQLGLEANKAGRIATTDLNRMEMSAKATAAALRGVPAQFTDIITSLQGGQAPMTVLFQQGGQLKDMFGGTANAARALGGYVAGLVNPYTVAAAAAAGLGIALYQGAKESRDLTNALILTGSTADYSASRLYKIADGVAAATGATKGAAIEAMTQVITAGKATEGSIEKVSEASLAMARATSQDVGDVVKQFADLGKAPVEASLKLNEQYNYLTASVYAQIYALKEQGKETEAVALAQKTFADATISMAGQVTANLGYIETGWNGVKSSVLGVIDAVKEFGREDTWQQQLDGVNKSLANRQSVGGTTSTTWFNTADLEKQKRVLEAIVAGEQDVARQVAAQNKERKEGVAAEETANKLRARYRTNEKKLSLEIEEINRSSLSVDEKRNAIALATERSTKKTKTKASDEYAEMFAFSARMSKISKELAAELAATEQANKSYAKAVADMLDPLAKEASALETEAQNYGLTRAEIDATAVSRLEEAVALATLNGASEEALSYLQRELELRKRIAAASADIASKKAAGDFAKDQEKAFVDAEKAIADARKKGWEETDRIARDVFTSIADDGSSAMEKIGKTLEKALLSAAYEATLQPLVFSFYTSALGGSTGTSGTGGAAGTVSAVGNALSTGSSAYNLATGGMASGFLSGMASVGSEAALGAAFVGPSATLASGSIGAGASVGSMFGSAASGIAAAIPWIGGAIAIGSLLGLFGGKKRADSQGAKVLSTMSADGEYTSVASGAADKYNASLVEPAEAINKNYLNTVSGLFSALDNAQSISFQTRMSAHGRDGDKLSDGFELRVGDAVADVVSHAYGKISWDDLIGKSFEWAMSEGIQSAVELSTLDDSLKALFEPLDGSAQVGSMVTNVSALATYSDELNDIWGISIEQAAEVATKTSESTDALIANVAAIAQFSAAQRSAGETLSLTRTDLLSAFDALSDADFPTTLADYDAAMKAVDTTVEGSIETFAELFALRASFAQYQTAIDGIKTSVSSAVFTLRSSAEQTAINQARLADAATAAGIAVPRSAAELVAMADAIDYTTESGINLALALPKLVEQFNAVGAAASAAGDDRKAEVEGRRAAQLALSDAMTAGAAEAKATADDLFASIQAGIKSVDDWLKSSLLGDTSVLSPEQKIAEAQAQFNALYRQVTAGDVGALDDLTSAADTLSNVARNGLGSSPAYVAIWEDIRTKLSGLGDGSQLTLEGRQAALHAAGVAERSANYETMLSDYRYKELATWSEAALQAGYDASQVSMIKSNAWHQGNVDGGGGNQVNWSGALNDAAEFTKLYTQVQMDNIFTPKSVSRMDSDSLQRTVSSVASAETATAIINALERSGQASTSGLLQIISELRTLNTSTDTMVVNNRLGVPA